MKISEQVQNKETKTALILEPWGVNEITSDEMQFLELVYISGKFFFLNLKKTVNS